GDSPYKLVLKQASDATRAAIKNGIDRASIEFPPVSGMLDVSLGQTLDANREHARELARAFSASLGQRLWLVFPDDSEARLAQKAFGGTTPFLVTSVSAAVRDGKASDCGFQLVVQPGFNIQEWLSMEEIYRGPGVPMVTLNGGLDKVRGGYYPRLFYPGLHAARERFLKLFEPVYYLKPLTNGWIFRCYPEPWQVLFKPPGLKATGRGGRGEMPGTAPAPVVLQTTVERPEYNAAAALIQKAALGQ
ncbi:unnamed protein product, partial [Phaeothamnion confervicola]